MEIVVLIVGYVIVGQKQGLAAAVLQLHPVVILLVHRCRVQVIDHCFVYSKRAVTVQALLKAIPARRRVLIARRGVQALFIATVGTQGHGYIPIAVGAEGGGTEVAVLISQPDSLVPGEAEVGVQLSPLPVLAGGEDHYPLPRLQAHFRQGPAQLIFPVGDIPAGDIHRLVALVPQLYPIGEVPVLVPEDGTVLLHEFTYHHQARSPAQFLRVGRSRGGG